MMKSRVFLIILTAAAAENGHIQRQVLFARTRNLPILPVVPPSVARDNKAVKTLAEMLDDRYETRLLNEINWFFPDKPDYDALFRRLKEALQR